MSTADTAAAILPNGVTLLVETVRDARSVAIGGWLRCGTRHESAEQVGIAHFLEHMVFRGGSHHTAQELARAIEMLGGRCDAYTTHEHTGYTLHVLPERLPRAVGLLSELIVRAKLDETAVETERRIILEEIAEAEDSPSDRVAELAVAQAWGEHPLAYPVLGTRRTVAGFTAQQVRAHRAVWYRAERLVLAAVGPITPVEVRPLVEQAFAMIGTGSLPDGTTPPAFAPGLISLRRNLDQVHVCLLYPGLDQCDVDRHALWLLDGLLGATTSSVLFQEVRERRGLAYHIAGSPQAHQDAGLYSIEALCGPKQVGEMLRVVRGAVAELLADGVTEDELIWVKEHARSTIVLGHESLGARLGLLARNWLAEARCVPLAETLAALEAVSPADIARVAQRVFGGGQVVLAVVGPVTPRREAQWWEAITA